MSEGVNPNIDPGSTPYYSDEALHALGIEPDSASGVFARENPERFGERVERETEERVVAENALASSVDDVFSKYADRVVEAEDGSQNLGLYMPWRGGARNRGVVIATLQLSRRGVGEDVSVGMTFSASGAWNSSVIFDRKGVRRAVRGEDGVLRSSHDEPGASQESNSSRTRTAQLWSENLAAAVPERPGLSRRVLARFVGKSALGQQFR